MPGHDFQVAVLGSGPVGMVAALELSKHYQTALITNGLPGADEPPRVEAVHASLLTTLIEYGIHPARIGVERLYESRLIAWESNHTEESKGPAAAHVERPALDLVLMDKLIACGRVVIISTRLAASLLRELGPRLIDATGRSAITSGKKIHPNKPWAARTFLAARRDCSATGELRIAALPGGFVYRLGSAAHVLLGIVGRRQTLLARPEGLERYLKEQRAEWILEGLPPVTDLSAGRITPASVQWTIGGRHLRMGDAALARDTLSSQGLAAGISEALYVAAIRDENGVNLLSLRQFEQRMSHLRSLKSLIERCRYRDCLTWKDYLEFIERHLVYDLPASKVALRSGRLQLLRESEIEEVGPG